MLQTAQLPDATIKQSADGEDTLFFIKHFAEKEDGQEVLQEFSKNYRGLTPFVNLYVTLCVTSLGWCGGRVPADDVLTKLNQASFLQRGIYKNRLGPRNQPADSQVLAAMLNIAAA